MIRDSLDAAPFIRRGGDAGVVIEIATRLKVGCRPLQVSFFNWAEQENKWAAITGIRGEDPRS